MEHLGTLIRLDRNTQSYMWIGWIGSLKHSHTRAPLCGAKKKDEKETDSEGNRGKEGNMLHAVLQIFPM